MKNNKRKFVHYTMLTFTYSVGAMTGYGICFALYQVTKQLLLK